MNWGNFFRRETSPSTNCGFRENRCYARPSGGSFREVRVKTVEVGPLDSFLEEGRAEPSWVGKFKDDTE
jgi:hypothetical protein